LRGSELALGCGLFGTRWVWRRACGPRRMLDSTPSFVEAAGECLGVKVIVVFSTLTSLFKADCFSLGIARLASMVDVLPRTSVGFHRSDRTCAGAPQSDKPALELHPLEPLRDDHAGRIVEARWPDGRHFPWAFRESAGNTSLRYVCNLRIEEAGRRLSQGSPKHHRSGA
jgi:hypothetical protein